MELLRNRSTPTYSFPTPKVQTLETEVEKLTQQLKHQNGLMKLDISLIDRDEHQPRKTFPTKSIEQRGRSLGC
jgi:ParB family transcriptional regulator, chromosome partitioning protein